MQIFEHKTCVQTFNQYPDFLRYIIQRKLEPKGMGKGAKGANRNNKASSKESILSRITSWFVQVETEKSSIPRIRIIIAKGESGNVRIITITKKREQHSIAHFLLSLKIVFVQKSSFQTTFQWVQGFKRWGGDECVHISIVKDRDDGKAFFVLKSIFLYMYTKIWRTSWKSWKTSSTMLLCLDMCHRCHTLLSPLFT